MLESLKQWIVSYRCFVVMFVVFFGFVCCLFHLLLAKHLVRY